MANILPFETQKKIWGMYRARFVIAASLMSLALSALAALALAPSYLALQLAAPPIAETAASARANMSNDVVAMARAQALVAAVGPLVAATSSPSQNILASLSGRPAGVVVTRITYTAHPSLITLGASASRAAVNAYRDALMKDAHFTSVDIPVDSLIGNSSSFTVSLKGNF